MNLETMEKNFDVVVIGSGPGGYVAAIRCAQLGYRTAIIEKYERLGGCCTNVGCIPAKALLDSTEFFHLANSKFQEHGIDSNGITLNFAQLMMRKREVVKQNTNGINFLMKKNKIEVIQGMASFLSSDRLEVRQNDSSVINVTSKTYIIATGSKPSTIPGIVIDKKRIITSTEALSLPENPKSMVIIGGGAIGVEMASIYARIGVRVTILEFMDSLLPTMDRDLGKELRKILTKTGVESLTSHQVKSVENNGEDVSVTFLDENKAEKVIRADYCLVAVGRKAYTEGLGLENTSIKTDTRGRIIVNEHLQTAHKNIFAIGDVINGPMLAHKSEEEGVFVAEFIHGQHSKINYELIPSVVYTWPEVSSVGSTEEELKKENIIYHVGKFPFAASGRARAAMESDGFVKVLTDVKYGEVLGVHIIGPRAADLIAQAVMGMHFESTDEDLTRISYAHPTYSEALKEAYLIASGQGALNL
jgi:dihydrolipoamide dehydrogenase